MSSVTVDWLQLGVEATHDRRRERRLPLAFAIEVSGYDLEAKFFSERTRTIDISESGCCFHLDRAVKRNGVIAIKIVRTHHNNEKLDRPMLYQVARIAKEPEGWTIGAAKLQSDSLWCVAFPPDNEPPSKKN
jgi:PilZ domain